MAVAAIAREGKALPWLDYSMLVFEFTADPSSNTIDVSTRGVTNVRMAQCYTNAGSLSTIGDKATVSSNGSLITFASGSSTVVTLVVIGR